MANYKIFGKPFEQFTEACKQDYQKHPIKKIKLMIFCHFFMYIYQATIRQHFSSININESNKEVISCGIIYKTLRSLHWSWLRDVSINRVCEWADWLLGLWVGNAPTLRQKPL